MSVATSLYVFTKRAFLSMLAFTGSSAFAQKDSDTFDLKANRIELQDRVGSVTFTGSVIGKQGQMTVEANSAGASYTGNVFGGNSSLKLNRLDAKGNVTITRPSETAKGDFAIYDLNKRIIILIGNVTLKRPGNFITGGRISINLDNNRAVMNGTPINTKTNTASIPNTTGRVTGSFTVPKKDVN